MSLAWIGLGSNLGKRKAHLRSAARALSRLGRARFASVYETTPVLPPGVAPQGDLFLNTACRLETERTVLEVFTALLDIERENQRTRPGRFAP
ncbi:MAG: 2-amino-4-hydroxy-6-hydroxymethyldihydropteridine diphosphokinase, partial [Acidobacteria bacterium]|nr:2-amino-4-hydroxy-6-hydroxymethyldihydropteridine diphosphokinase [Acidobacteriota bacterium]